MDKLGLEYKLDAVFKSNMPTMMGVTKYDIYYTPTYNDVPLNYTQNDVVNAESYAAAWLNERVHMQVNDDGITLFEWFAPSKQLEVMVENANLLEFNEVEQIAKKNIEYSFAWQDYDNDVIEKRVTVYKIKLGMMKVRIKDSTDKYMVIPVWDFYGHLKEVYDPDSDHQLYPNEDGEYVMEWYNDYAQETSILTINAIDGSVIDREKGY